MIDRFETITNNNNNIHMFVYYYHDIKYAYYNDNTKK